MKKLIFLLLTFSLIISCTKITHVSSKDWKNCVTIINKGSKHKRYNVLGNKEKSVKDNYRDLDISKVYPGPFTENILICWPDSQRIGKIIVPNLNKKYYSF